MANGKKADSKKTDTIKADSIKSDTGKSGVGEPDSVKPGKNKPDSSKADSLKKAPHADIFKFVGLIAFIVVMIIAIISIWPFVGDLFQEGGVERLTSDIRNAGWQGIFILEALQFLQVVVAFIPGEVVQMAAGIIYGPWIGALLIFIGCVISSAFVFAIVHFLGAPFVHDMVPKKYLDKLSEFEHSKRFNVIVFVLYLIPGMPKDVFTYILPLSNMKFGTFVAITNLARIPGIVISTYAADGLIEGRIWESVVIFLVLAAIAITVLLTYNKILDAFRSISKHDDRK